MPKGKRMREQTCMQVCTRRRESLFRRLPVFWKIRQTPRIVPYPRHRFNGRSRRRSLEQPAAIKDIRRKRGGITAAMQKNQPRRPSALSMAESMPFGERSPAHISSAWRRTYSLHQVATFLLRREPGGRAALQSAYSASSAAIMRPMRSLICPIWFFVTPKRSATLSMESSSSTYAR